MWMRAIRRWARLTDKATPRAASATAHWDQLYSRHRATHLVFFTTLRANFIQTSWREPMQAWRTPMSRALWPGGLPFRALMRLRQMDTARSRLQTVERKM